MFRELSLICLQTSGASFLNKGVVFPFVQSLETSPSWHDLLEVIREWSHSDQLLACMDASFLVLWI